jgi:hypothetical protein
MALDSLQGMESVLRHCKAKRSAKRRLALDLNHSGGQSLRSGHQLGRGGLQFGAQGPHPWGGIEGGQGAQITLQISQGRGGGLPDASHQQGRASSGDGLGDRGIRLRDRQQGPNQGSIGVGEGIAAGAVA